MLKRVILGLGIVAGFAGLARASAQDDIQAALQKLSDSPNYTWKSTVEGGFGAGDTTGKTQKDGLTSLSISRQDNTFEVIIQGSKAAIKTDDGWKTPSELANADNGGGGGPAPGRFMAMMVQNFKTPVATAQEMAGKLENVKKTDDGYTADLTEDAAKQLLTFRRRRNANAAAPEISNAKASVTIWIKDGVVTKLQNHVTGTVTFNGNDNDVDRTTTTEFSDVGSTTITVPDEAKAKLAAPPATQP
jgi:hypothetical protein